MSQIPTRNMVRKFAEGGSNQSQTQTNPPKYGSFIRNGNREEVTNDWLKRMDDWALQQDQDTQQTWGNARNQLLQGKDVNLDQFQGTLSSNVEFNNLNERQQERLKKNRSSFGMFMDAVVGSKVHRAATSIQNLDNLPNAPVPAPVVQPSIPKQAETPQQEEVQEQEETTPVQAVSQTPVAPAGMSYDADHNLVWNNAPSERYYIGNDPRFPNHQGGYYYNGKFYKAEDINTNKELGETFAPFRNAWALSPDYNSAWEAAKTTGVDWYGSDRNAHATTFNPSTQYNQELYDYFSQLSGDNKDKVYNISDLTSEYQLGEGERLFSYISPDGVRDAMSISQPQYLHYRNGQTTPVELSSFTKRPGISGVPQQLNITGFETYEHDANRKLAPYKQLTLDDGSVITIAKDTTDGQLFYKDDSSGSKYSWVRNPDVLERMEQSGGKKGDLALLSAPSPTEKRSIWSFKNPLHAPKIEQKKQGGVFKFANSGTIPLMQAPRVPFSLENILKGTYTPEQIAAYNNARFAYNAMMENPTSENVRRFQESFGGVDFLQPVVNHVAGQYGTTAVGNHSDLGANYNYDGKRGAITKSWEAIIGDLQNAGFGSNPIFNDDPSVTPEQLDANHQMRTPQYSNINITNTPVFQNNRTVAQSQKTPETNTSNWKGNTINLPDIGVNANSIVSLGRYLTSLKNNNRAHGVIDKAIKTAMGATESTVQEVYPRFTDYGVNAAYQNAAQQQLGVKPATSDYLTAHAIEQDAKNRASQLQLEGRLKTSELFSNYLNRTDELRRQYAGLRTDVTNRNRQRLAQLNMAKAENEASRITANNQSVQNLMQEWQANMAQNQAKKEQWDMYRAQQDYKGAQTAAYDRFSEAGRNWYNSLGTDHSLGEYSDNLFQTHGKDAYTNANTNYQTALREAGDQAARVAYGQRTPPNLRQFHFANSPFYNRNWGYLKNGGILKFAKGSKATSTTRSKQTLNPAEHIWVNQNNNTAEALRQLHKAVIDLFTKATS